MYICVCAFVCKCGVGRAYRNSGSSSPSAISLMSDKCNWCCCRLWLTSSVDNTAP